jgi:hypothetical protein
MKTEYISLLYINLTEECKHVLPRVSMIIEVNKLYYKYKSNNETIFLHPEIPSPITGFHTTS